MVLLSNCLVCRHLRIQDKQKIWEHFSRIPNLLSMTGSFSTTMSIQMPHALSLLLWMAKEISISLSCSLMHSWKKKVPLKHEKLCVCLHLDVVSAARRHGDEDMLWNKDHKQFHANNGTSLQRMDTCHRCCSWRMGKEAHRDSRRRFDGRLGRTSCRTTREESTVSNLRNLSLHLTDENQWRD